MDDTFAQLGSGRHDDLSAFDHLLHRVPYTPVPHEEITLPSRVCDPNYERRNLPPELYVPQKY